MDLTPYLGRCKSCRAPIAWAVTAEGKAIPMNTHPSPNGNTVLWEQLTLGEGGPGVVG